MSPICLTGNRDQDEIIRIIQCHEMGSLEEAAQIVFIDSIYDFKKLLVIQTGNNPHRIYIHLHRKMNIDSDR